MIPKKKAKPTKAQLERGVGTLNSLRIVINVLYALMIFQIFLILPRPDDPDLATHTLSQIFGDHVMQLVMMVVGIILIIIYWVQFNAQLGNLVRSSPVHATLAIIQMFFLMIYLYFLRFDMEFDGMKLALQMESIFLALAGFVAAYNWRYARRNGLTSDQITDNEELNMFYKILPEPMASLFTLPFASLGPLYWTLAFLVIIPFGFVLKFVRRKYDTPEIVENP